MRKLTDLLNFFHKGLDHYNNKNWDKAIILPIESFEGTIPLDVIWRNSKRQAIRESNKVRVQRK